MFCLCELTYVKAAGVDLWHPHSMPLCRRMTLISIVPKWVNYEEVVVGVAGFVFVGMWYR